jgi:transposase-like protein
VPGHSLKVEVAADIRAVFNAPRDNEAEALLARLAQKYENRASRLANWMETKLDDSNSNAIFLLGRKSNQELLLRKVFCESKN